MTDNMAFIRTVWMKDITAQNKVQKEAQKIFKNHDNPMAYALSELLKGQLELTANFLSSQKSLYTNYCASLEKILKEPPVTHADFEKVLHARYVTYTHKIRTSLR